MTDFERAMAFVMRWEGGKVDHPNDPGGRTNMGVTQRTYDAWRKAASLQVRDVYAITEDERDAIYRANYWNASHCPNLAWPLSLVVFDTAVNCGVSRALRWLEASSPGPTADEVLELREDHYKLIVDRNPKLSVFARGWANRLAALRKEAV